MGITRRRSPPGIWWQRLWGRILPGELNVGRYEAGPAASVRGVCAHGDRAGCGRLTPLLLPELPRGARARESVIRGIPTPLARRGISTRRSSTPDGPTWTS